VVAELSDDCNLSLCRHLQEHLKDFTGGDMSLDSKNEEEIEFHYFKLHDYDNNNKLGRQSTCVMLCRYVCVYCSVGMCVCGSTAYIYA